MKKLFIITGEYSGDIHASNVVRELKALNCDLEIEGIGGMNLEKEGVKLFANQEKMLYNITCVKDYTAILAYRHM